MKNSLWKKFLKFALTWVFTYGINIWLTYFLNEKTNLDENFSYVISLCIVFIFNFLISLKFTFVNYYSHKLLLKYSITLAFFQILNYLLVFAIKNYFDLNYYISIFLITTFIFFLKFFVYNKFVFVNIRTSD